MNPPLSHPPVSAPPLTTPPTGPVSEHQPSLEHLLLRFGLVTLDQLSAAMREQTETGTPYTDVLVRDGVVKPEDLARVADRSPAMSPTEPEPAPEPPPLAAEIVPEEEPIAVFELPVEEPQLVDEPVAPEPVAVEPEPVFVPEPAFVPEAVVAPAPVATGFVVRGRLVTGEEIEIASVDDTATAQRIARDAMRACARSEGADWPILNGRYVRPDSIVSIEVTERF